VTDRVSIVSPRLDAKPWGGRRLESLGISLPPAGEIGEALLTANEAEITAGAHSGQTLGGVVATDLVAALGSRGLAAVGGRAIFPLLAKLIDASENLSIQVHPDDDQAAPLDRLGKTEAWHVLGVDPGATLYLGLQPGSGLDRFAEAASRLDGSSAALMRTVPAQAATTVLVPAGTIHALGAGVLVYEIQQPSDVTYRLDDWGRVDAAGRPREMHLEQGFAVSRPELLPELIAPVRLRHPVGERHLLAACRFFALERIALPAGGRFDAGDAGSPTVITVVTGAAAIAGHELEVGQSAVIWPGVVGATALAAKPLVALVASVPDLAALRRVAGAAGASEFAIAALAGATGDLVPGASS
jgi:mannose-6-phosphate isomerase